MNILSRNWKISIYGNLYCRFYFVIINNVDRKREFPLDIFASRELNRGSTWPRNDVFDRDLITGVCLNYYDIVARL